MLGAGVVWETVDFSFIVQMNGTEPLKLKVNIQLSTYSPWYSKSMNTSQSVGQNWMYLMSQFSNLIIKILLSPLVYKVFRENIFKNVSKMKISNFLLELFQVFNVVFCCLDKRKCMETVEKSALAETDV